MCCRSQDESSLVFTAATLAMSVFPPKFTPWGVVATACLVENVLYYQGQAARDKQHFEVAARLGSAQRQMAFETPFEQHHLQAQSAAAR